MLRTIFGGISFILIMLLYTLVAIPVFFFIIFKLTKIKDKYIIVAAKVWSWFLIFIAGIDLEIIGKQNVPKHDNICIVSNHQSFFDIPILLYTIPKVVGFIAKKQMIYIPIINIWMVALNCPYIDRKSREQSLKKIKQRLRMIKKGQPMLIFPEGTRSLRNKMSPFKYKGLKSIIEEEVIILPVTLVNTYKVFQKEKKKIVPTKVKIFVHKEIDVNTLSLEEKENLIPELEKLIDPMNNLKS